MMNGLVNCASYNNDCSHSLLQNLCHRLKPPEFPVWIHDSDKQQLQEKCSSWKSYTALCFGVNDTTTAISEEYFTDITTDDYIANVTEIDISTTSLPLKDVSTQSSPSTILVQTSEIIASSTENTINITSTTENYTENLSEPQLDFNHTLIPEAIYEDGGIKSGKSWIVPGVTFFIAALIIFCTILIYKWYRKYSMETQIYIDYDYLHHKGKKKEKWKGVHKKPEIIDVEKSVMFISSDNDIFISENHKLGEKAAFDENRAGNKIVDLQTQSFGEDPLYVLPSTFPEVTISTDCENSFTDELDQDFSLPPLSLTTTGLKGTLETGFINPAYEGTESIIDASLPRKKKKRRFPFLKILRKSKREKRI